MSSEMRMHDDEGRCLCGCTENCAVVAELRGEIARLRAVVARMVEEDNERFASEAALLARTEAGADGYDDGSGRVRDWRESDTRPQDASGDAVTGRVNGYMLSARAIEIIADGEVPEWITKAPGLRVTITAMQAKEAK